MLAGACEISCFLANMARRRGLAGQAHAEVSAARIQGVAGRVLRRFYVLRGAC